MSSKLKYRNVKITDEEMDAIKVEGLRQFLIFANNQSLSNRIRFAIAVVFKALKI